MQAEVTQRVRNTGSAVLIAAGLTVLAGWQFRIGFLKGEMLGTFVAPLTALLFILCGASVLLQWARYRWLQPLGVALGASVVLVAGALLFEYATGIASGMERFFAHRMGDWNVDAPPGRIALPTAIAFVIAGAGLAVLRWRPAAHVAELTASLVAAISYLALVGYLFHIEYLYGRVMALPTAALLAVLASVLFCSTSRGLFTSVLFSPDAGGIALRRIGPAVVLALPLIGWLRLQAQAYNLASLEQSTALHVMVVALLFGWVSWNTAVALNELDAERKRAHAALVRSEKLAATGRLAATVAHEINNPLEAVINLLYLLRREPGLAPAAREWLEQADAQLLRVAQITRQTLGFYRGASGISAVPLRPAISEIVQLYEPRAAQRRTALRQGVTDGAVLADPGELRQVIGNLVSNALDAVSDDGTGVVAVTVHDRQDGRVEIRVTDNGCGIAPEHLPRLFEPFFTTKEAHGTGLGLWVTKQLVEKNGATLEIVSSASNGGPPGTTAVVTCRRAPVMAAAKAS